MAHLINFNQKTGKDSFFSVKQKARHGLGQIVDRYPTSAEAIQFAGLDYIVEKRPLFTYDTENHLGDPDEDIIIPEISVPNYFATVRADTEQVLGVVGNDYEVVQNRDAFTFFDAIVGGGDGILYETAGALGNGERIFITAKLPGYIKVGKDDLIEKYLFLTTSHDGFGSITAAFTPTRIVCNNTLHAALNDMTNSVKIRHTESAKERLLQAHKIMGITNTMTDQLNGIFNQWAQIRITDKEVLKLVQQAMAPSKEVLQKVLDEENLDEYSSRFTNTIERVCEYAFSNETQQMETTKGTLFGAYNAITGYFQNVMHYKNDEAKLKSILFGNGFNKTQSAFNLCSEFAKNGETVFELN
jgi:phage/plasmid-like protein (TIGR03299 family)